MVLYYFTKGNVNLGADTTWRKSKLKGINVCELNLPH